MKNTAHVPSKKRTFSILLAVGLLSIVGLVFVFESSVAESFNTFNDPYFLLKQQLIGFVIGTIALIIALFIPTKVWLGVSPILYIASIVGLILVFIPGIGLNLNGASRWMNIAGVTIQPVEFLKLSLILYFSSWLSKHQRFGPLLFLLGIPVILLLLQPDLGSMLLISAIGICMYFVAGGDIKRISILGLIAIPILIALILLEPYRMQRLKTFIDPSLDPQGSSFHIRQITLALGRGGWFGQGLGNSRQRFSFIPEASTDSIFSIAAEEVGFLGSLLILILFGFLFIQIFKVSKLPKLDPRLKLLSLGILCWFVLQTILNLSAVVALVPLTGVPLPFFSYGRSSLIMLLLATGIIVRISREAKT